jgi:hypothetical protein
MTRIMTLLSSLGLIVPFVLLWFSPWLPPDAPPAKLRISLRQLMVIIAVAAWFLAGARAVVLEILQPPAISWR